MSLSLKQMLEILDECKFGDYEFILTYEGQVGRDSVFEQPYYLQAKWTEPCIKTGKPEPQSSRKWRISKHMTKSELVQTCFAMCLMTMEHRARETFQYRGKRIFGPHYNVDALVGICHDDNLDYRRDE